MLKCSNYCRRINQTYSNFRVCKSFAGLYKTLYLLFSVKRQGKNLKTICACTESTDLFLYAFNKIFIWWPNTFNLRERVQKKSAWREQLKIQRQRDRELGRGGGGVYWSWRWGGGGGGGPTKCLNSSNWWVVEDGGDTPVHQGTTGTLMHYSHIRQISHWRRKK